jgi:hypothetical protein
MKRLIRLSFILMFALLLVACQKTTSATASIELKEEDAITLTGVFFDVNIEDPDGEITGIVTVRLHRADGTEHSSKPFEDISAIKDVSFTGLQSDTTYTIKVHATTGRTTQMIGEYTFTTLTTATIEITTAEEFLNMKNNRSGTYKLMNDIDFTDVEFQTPFTSSFSGTFDGQGFTLSNITFTRITTYTGVFGYISSGKVHDVVLDNVQIGTEEAPLSMATSSRVGIFAGYVSSSTAVIENVTIKNSNIHFNSSSTVQAYVGGAVGELRGRMTDVVLENVEISLRLTSYGRVKMGGAVGLLEQDALFRRVKSETNVTFVLDYTGVRDVTFASIFVGGLIGDNIAINKTRAVEHVYNVGDVKVTLDYNTPLEHTRKTYLAYVGGLVGGSSAAIHNAFYAGHVEVNHQTNGQEGNIQKWFTIGGVIGFYQYGSSTSPNTVLRVGTGYTTDLNISDDVNLRFSQTFGNYASSVSIQKTVFGEEHLNLNGVTQVPEEDTVVITDVDEFFTSDWIKEAFNAYFGETE